MKVIFFYRLFTFEWITFATISLVRCSGENTKQNHNPAAAASSSSSSTGWINNVLIDSPSVSHSPILVQNEAQEMRAASSHSSANSYGWADDANGRLPAAAQHSLHQKIHSPSTTTVVPSEVHQIDQNKGRNASVALPYTQEIASGIPSISTPLRKYKYKEGTRKTKEANWRIHDHERWLRHTTKKSIKRKMERKGFVSFVSDSI